MTSSATPTPLHPVPPKPDGPDLSHQFAALAEVPLDDKTAKIADFRGSFKAHEGQRINALEVICRLCRRPREDVADQDCEAKIDNTHLIGGDQRERKKRKIGVVRGDRVVTPGPRINRRGIDGVLSREA